MRNLIKQCRTPRQKQLKQEEELSIWRRTADGGRVCQIPAIYDEVTGVTLQAMMESEGATAQNIVTHAIALRSAYIEGKLILNPDFADCPCNDVAQEDITPQSLTLEDDGQFDDESEPDDVISAIEFEVETSAQFSLQTELHEITSTVTQAIKSQAVPRWQLGWNVGDSCIANQKSQHFHEWCDGEQVQIQSVVGRVGTIQFICVVRADGEVYDTFGGWIEEVPTRQFQVGDKVMWTNCYAHLSSWQPFVITNIDGDKAKLDIYEHPVPLNELELC